MDTALMWIAFNGFVLAMLALDLFVFHRESHVVRVREAAGWSAFWVALALGFNFLVYQYRGPEAGLEFLTGYLLEKALSVDNIFVFVLIFGFFRVPPQYQHRILFWGVLGALVMRGAMIAAGSYLIHHFEFVIYIFGAFLIITGIRMALQKEESIDFEGNPIIRLMRRIMPVTATYEGQTFFVKREVTHRGRTAVRWIATPLFVVLVLVETTDLIFALDSIPAVFAVTTDPFIVYTSNVFAILGLRALYFLLAGVMHKFHYLKLGLSAVLVFVGAKMTFSHFYKIPVTISLAVIAGVLAVSVAASMLFPPKHPPAPPVQQPDPEPLESGL